MKTTKVVEQVSETLSSISESERQQLIKELEALLQMPSKEEEPDNCPRCDCDRIVRKGRTKTGQRYLCKGCGRSFGMSTGKVLGSSKLPLSTWREYIKCFIDRVPLRRAAVRCQVSLKTSFFMRHRILELVEKARPKTRVGLGNTAQVDETFIRFNFKGTTPPGRQPYKRGKSMATKCRSKNHMCVVMGVTNTGSVFYQIAGGGNMTINMARRALSSVVRNGSHIITDKASCYPRAVHDLGATHTAYHSKDERGELAQINALHSRTKRFLRLFGGVASKYLPRYLSWMLWLDSNAENETMNTVVEGTYTVTRSKMTGDKLPPLDHLTRQTVAHAI